MNETEIDKYLFNEMSEIERDEFENRFVSDDALFFEIAERENEFVDMYASGKLRGGELKRFESSLASLPARRQKIENAKVLGELIADERPEEKAITIAERTGFFSRLFSFGPSLQFASVAAVVLLAVASIFLWTENRRLGSLQQELAASRQRESELATQANQERETAGDLTADLEAERERIATLETEIARLRNSSDHPPVNNPPVTIATLVLTNIGVRGGSSPVRRLELPNAATRVSIVIGIPSDAAFTDSVSVILNGERMADNQKPKIRRGEKSVSITVPASRFNLGRNELAVRDSKDSAVASYVIAVTQAK